MSKYNPGHTVQCTGIQGLLIVDTQLIRPKNMKQKGDTCFADGSPFV